jgi:glutathione S-transferase
LKDAGLDFQDNRYAYDESWAVTSLDLQKRGVTITGKVPVLEYNGTILSQHLPILRYLSRELKSYDGQTSLEKYLVDAVADIYNDWRVRYNLS